MAVTEFIWISPSYLSLYVTIRSPAKNGRTVIKLPAVIPSPVSISDHIEICVVWSVEISNPN
jgi:hypothetical protein